jgi:hypothetical protein
MNQLTYHIAMTRQEELLRQAAARRLAMQVAAARRPLTPRATRSRGGSHWTIRGIAATLRVRDQAPAIPTIRGQA